MTTATLPSYRTMTSSQMSWNLAHGHAWFGMNSDGEAADDTFDPIYTRHGEWLWCPPDGTHGGRYEMR